jgi:hypothetical protein
MNQFHCTVHYLAILDTKGTVPSQPNISLFSKNKKVL